MTAEHGWRRRRLAPTVYDIGVEHEWIARTGGRLLWGADVRPMYTSFAGAGALPPGGSVLDVPCGGGVAFRGLTPRPDLRYVAADLSPVMLARARAAARRRGVHVAFAQASADRLPFPPDVFDLCATYNGLHCLRDPASAVAEMTRVLRPGGVLRGTTLVTGAGRRQDALIALLRARGDFGNPGGEADLRRWLADAGLLTADIRRSGALVYFTAEKPSGDRG